MENVVRTVRPAMTIRFPNMRSELIEHLRALEGDGELELDMVIHFLFDDAPRPADALGAYLETVGEVQVVTALVDALDELLEKYGTDLRDEEYTKRPEWVDIRAKARAARRWLIA